MRMKIICGDEDCREEFYADTKEPVWECQKCGREIMNRNYPFLTARLMQARIDGDSADWKARYTELIVEARKEIAERSQERESDTRFLDDAEKELSRDHPTEIWRKLHDELLEKGRRYVLELEK